MPGILILDELQSATEGGGIKLKDPLQTQDGTPLLSPSGEVSINFDNLANNTIHMNKLNIPDDGMTGDKIHGGTISGFQSTGITDNASNTALTISSDGNVSLNGNLVIGSGIPALGLMNIDGYHIKDNATYGRTWYYGTRYGNIPGNHLVHVGYVNSITTTWTNIFSSTTGGHQGYWFEIFLGLVDVCCNSTSGGYARGRVQGSASYSGGGGIDESTYIGAQIQVQAASNQYIQVRTSTGSAGTWYTLKVYGNWNYNTHSFPSDQ